MKAEAVSVDSGNDAFAAGVAHELKAPVTAILGWLSMLRSESRPPEFLDRALDAIERNALRQARLIERWEHALTSKPQGAQLRRGRLRWSTSGVLGTALALAIASAVLVAACQPQVSTPR